jgi:DNA uptake protein ComE-like DNA-binding protein
MRRNGWLTGPLLIAALAIAGCASPAVGLSQPAVAPTASQMQATAATTSTSGTTGAQMTGKVNLNTATPEQLLTIPGVGDRMVREFTEYRPYTSIQQFRREIGKYVSADQVAAYEQYVFVPVDPNTADAATLQQLPGVSSTIADQLVAGRPYASSDSFSAKLGQLVSGEQAAAALAFLSQP